MALILSIREQSTRCKIIDGVNARLAKIELSLAHLVTGGDAA